MGEAIREENQEQQQLHENNVIEKLSESATDCNNNVPKFEMSELKVFSPVGRGAKGVVFHTRIENSDEDLALKVVLKSATKRSRSLERSIGFEQSRVFFEQQVLRELDHPLLPRLCGVFETINVFGYAIDYCSGGNLSVLRKQQVEQMFSDDIIRFYGAEMVLALEYLHNKGIVYRDLKPDNVLIQDNGHLMLVDFDLSTKLVPISQQTRSRSSSSCNSEKKPRLERKKSQLPMFYAFSFCKSGISAENSFNSGVNSANSVDTSESDSVGKSNSFVGTEEYVAPEIIQGNGHDFAVDWWSLGVVLHEMLYGTTPFRGANRKETFYRILSKTPELVGETTPLRDLIRKLLEKDPKQRITLDGIKGHDFFKGVDWDMILRLSRPPFIPGRPEMGEGMDGIKPIDVESVVYGIFKMEIPSNNTTITTPNNTHAENIKGTKGEEEIKISIKNNKESIDRGVWVEGLEQPSVSSDFSVF